MNTYEKILELLLNDWIDKKFVYCSKYGSETIGIIKNVDFKHKFIFDNETNERIKKSIIDKNNPHKNELLIFKENIETKKNKNYKWFGSRYDIIITSDNNQTYNYNEIYILE
jgi:hypothetical protein